MKAEQRHRLESNDLAARVGRVVQSVKSAPATQSLALWLGVLAVVIVIIAWQLFRSASFTETSGLWRTVDAATESPGEVINTLQSIQEEHPGTTAGTSAGYMLARRKLGEGQANLGNALELDRKDAIKNLLAARDMYVKLAKDSADIPLLMQESLMMQAKIEESLIGVPDPDKAGSVLSTLDKAKEAYQNLANKYPDSAAGMDAKKRLEDLDKNKAEVEQFYTEYNKILTASRTPSPINTSPAFNTPALPQLPEGLRSPEKPPIDLTPKTGDGKAPITLPAKPGDGKTAPGAKAPADQKLNVPSAPATKKTEPVPPKPGDAKSTSSPDKKK